MLLTNYHNVKPWCEDHVKRRSQHKTWASTTPWLAFSLQAWFLHLFTLSWTRNRALPRCLLSMRVPCLYIMVKAIGLLKPQMNSLQTGPSLMPRSFSSRDSPITQISIHASPDKEKAFQFPNRTTGVRRIPNALVKRPQLPKTAMTATCSPLYQQPKIESAKVEDLIESNFQAKNWLIVIKTVSACVVQLTKCWPGVNVAVSYQNSVILL